MLISEVGFAKYPFTKEAIEQVTKLDLKIDELLNPDYVEIINRAEQRIEEALIEGIVKWRETSYAIEILSFPVAIIFVTAIGDDFLKRRYALAEAKRTNELLKREKEDKLVEIVESFLKWKVEKIDDNPPYSFSLNFTELKMLEF